MQPGWPSAAAAEELERAEIGADVVCLTSPDLVYRALEAERGLADGDRAVLDRILPAERAAPTVTVIDGHPSALAFVGQIRGVRCTSLGVREFGQSGDISDLYPHHGIDAETIVGAAADLI